MKFTVKPVDMSKDPIPLDVFGASTIGDAIEDSIEVARRFGKRCRFEFNGVNVTVAGDSKQGLIYRDWGRALSGYIDKSVGPYPKPELSEADKASDAAQEQINELRRQERHAEWDRRAREKELALRGALSVAPAAPTFRDREAWEKTVAANTDGYGGGVMKYAERWARLMEARINTGEIVADCAKDASHLADVEGITGFMYGCAVSILSKCWIHGKELRRWHNLDSQIGNEGEAANESGGVLNPALLSVTIK